MRIPYISILAASSIALGGCAYDGLGLGMGYGNGYDPYGYGYGGYGYGSPYYGSSYGYGSRYYGSGYGYGGPSISIGIGSGYGGYYGSPYGRYGYGYGSPYYGWYDNFYYPGAGYYVYDTYRRPYTMTTAQRQYWSTRSPALRTASTTRTTVKPNWSGFNRKDATARQRVRENHETRVEQRREDRHNNR
jgi:hypothetical protein